MKIFEIEINGQTAEYFCSLSTFEKIGWIKKNTIQTDDIIINEFLKSRYKGSKVCCAKCGEKYDISKTNAVEVATVTSDNNTRGDGKRGVNKRRKQSKTT